MGSLLLQLLSERVESSRIKRVSGSKGGEWHSPCPLCGGDDRFMSFPEQEGGELCQRHGVSGRWACRQCGKGGDMLTWFMEIEGLPFKRACESLRIELDAVQCRRSYRPLRVPPSRSDASAPFVPSAFDAPSAIWRAQATKLAFEAHARLLQSPSILGWLERRGLPKAAVDRYRLGYIEAEGRQTDCIFRSRAAFGLPDKVVQGRLVRALRIPRGVTIPAWSPDGGECWRIRIRRRDADIDKNNPSDPKYLLLPQPERPYSAPLLLRPEGVSPDLATWVVVESELDAMTVHHACGGRVGALAVLTVAGKPDVAAHATLTRSPRILVALDFDQDKADGKNPGAAAWPWWRRAYPQARLWPVPDGKDPGDAFARGVDLREWISPALPPCAALLPLAGEGDAARKVLSSCGDDGSVTKKEFKKRGEGRHFRCLPVPDVASFDDVVLPDGVSHAELLRAFGSVSPKADALIPCPRTRPPFWWRYVRDCRGCGGHPQCLADLLRSDLFRSAAHAS